MLRCAQAPLRRAGAAGNDAAPVDEREFGKAGIAELLKRAADAACQHGGDRGGFDGGRSSGHRGPRIIDRMMRLGEIDGV